MNKSKYPSEVTLWLPVFVWAIVIFTLSSIPQIKVSEFTFWDFAAKKTAHVAEYAILFSLIFRATGKKQIRSFLLTIIYAISDEYHQSFVDGRNSSFPDLVIDFSGASIASYIIWKLNQVRRAKPKK